MTAKNQGFLGTVPTLRMDLKTSTEISNGLYHTSNYDGSNTHPILDYPNDWYGLLLKTQTNTLAFGDNNQDAWQSGSLFIKTNTHSRWNPVAINANTWISIYLDNENGDDNNTGLNSYNAVKTFDRAIRIASAINSRYGINFCFSNTYWGDIDFSIQLSYRHIVITNWDNTPTTESTTENNPVFNIVQCRHQRVGIRGGIFRSLYFYNCGVSMQDMKDTKLNHIKIEDGELYLAGTYHFKYDELYSRTDQPCISCSRSRLEVGSSVKIIVDDNIPNSAFIGLTGFNNIAVSSTNAYEGNFNKKRYAHQGNAFCWWGYRLDTVFPGTGLSTDEENINVIIDCNTEFITNYRNQYFQGSLVPKTDNTYSLGLDANSRWKEVYAATGTIQTSDERVKTNVSSIPEEVFEAWSTVNFKQFKFTDAVEEKGENARLHIGMIAQEILSAFQTKGLDATKYGLICHDTWGAKEWDETVIDQEAEYGTREVVVREAYIGEEGNEIPAEMGTEEYIITPEKSHVVHHNEPAGDRYSLRYDECLALECAYQRWMLEKLVSKLS